MLSQKKNKKGLYIALLACLAVLALVVILENTLSPT